MYRILSALALVSGVAAIAPAPQPSLAAAPIPDMIGEPLIAHTAMTSANPSNVTGNSTRTLSRVPSTAPISELQSAIMTMRKTFRK